MKKIFAVIFTLVGFAAQAQIPQKTKTWWDYNFLIVDTLGVPRDTVSIPESQRSRPFISSKNDEMYVWSVTLRKWVKAGGGTGGAILASDTAAMLSGYTHVQRFLDSLSAIRGDLSQAGKLFGLGDSASTGESRFFNLHGDTLSISGGTFMVNANTGIIQADPSLVRLSHTYESNDQVNQVQVGIGGVDLSSLVAYGSAKMGIVTNGLTPYLLLRASANSGHESRITVDPDSLALKAYNGDLRINYLGAAADTAGRKAMVWNPSTRKVEVLPYGGGSSTSSRFGKSGEDNSLSEARTVNQNGYGITFNNGAFSAITNTSGGSWGTLVSSSSGSSMNTFVGAGVATTGTALSGVKPYSYLRGEYQSSASYFRAYPDSLWFSPQGGALRITQMQTTVDSAFKPMVYNPLTDEWKQFSYWPGWGGTAGSNDSTDLYLQWPLYAEDDSILAVHEFTGPDSGYMTPAMWAMKANAAHVHAASDITSGTISILRGGTGLSALGTAGQSLRVNSGGTALEYYTPSSGGGSQSLNDVATVGATTAIPLTLSGKLTLGGGATIEAWTAAGAGTTWIDMPTGGPSGMGHGGPGINPWIARVAYGGQYLADAGTGDIIYRGTGRLMWGNASATSGMYLDSNTLYLRKAPVSFALAGTGTRVPMISSTGALGALANGSNGQILKLVSGTPAWVDAPAGGITDHGALTGLSDDDHAQYLLLAGRSGQTIADRINVGGGTVTTGPTLFVDVDNTHTGYAFAVGQEGNAGYFTIDKSGNITNLGGYSISIVGSGSGAYFPNGISFLQTASAQNGGAVLKGLSYNQPWVFDNSAITSNGVVGLTVKGSNAGAPGDLLQLLTHNGSTMFKLTFDGTPYFPALGSPNIGLLSLDQNGKVLNTEFHPDSLVSLLSGPRQRGVSLVTNNSTTSTIAAITPMAYEMGVIEVTMTGLKAASTDGITGKKVVRYFWNGSTLTLGTITDLLTTQADGTLSSASWSITTSGGNILVQVTGIASTTISWNATYSITKTTVVN